MDKSYDVIATEALARRKKLNTPWEEKKPSSLRCIGCGNPNLSKISYVLCDSCTKQAYDVLEES